MVIQGLIYGGFFCKFNNPPSRDSNRVGPYIFIMPKRTHATLRYKIPKCPPGSTHGLPDYIMWLSLVSVVYFSSSLGVADDGVAVCEILLAAKEVRMWHHGLRAYHNLPPGSSLGVSVLSRLLAFIIYVVLHVRLIHNFRSNAFA